MPPCFPMYWQKPSTLIKFWRAPPPPATPSPPMFSTPAGNPDSATFTTISIFQNNIMLVESYHLISKNLKSLAISKISAILSDTFKIKISETNFRNRKKQSKILPFNKSCLKLIYNWIHFKFYDIWWHDYKYHVI